MKIELKCSTSLMKRGLDEDRGAAEPKPKRKRATREQPLDLTGFEGDVNTLKDLIRLAHFIKDHKKSRRKQKTGVMTLVDCIEELEDLDSMVGLDELKDDITRQIMFFTLGLNGKEMMHTVISGPPGMGKTTSIEKMAAIYAKMGFLSIGHVVSATRGDLVDQYLGGTAIKTGIVLEASKGGVLLIDEAYSLGDEGGRDSFSKECINTINQFLSENPENFMCIIAGYEKELKKNFFGANPGLERRFQWWFRLKPYSLTDLVRILQHQTQTQEWKLAEDVTAEWLAEQLRDGVESGMFSNNGGDTMILFDKCKVCHSKRVFLDSQSERRRLTRKDITDGHALFKVYKNKHKRGMSESMRHMYC